MAPVLRLDNVHLAYGSRPLLEQASLQVEPGERVCIVGRNGEGKSSLMRLVNGDALPDAGTVWLRPGARRAHLPQDIATVTGETVREVVAGGLPEVARLLADYHATSDRYAQTFTDADGDRLVDRVVLDHQDPQAESLAHCCMPEGTVKADGVERGATAGDPGDRGDQQAAPDRFGQIADDGAGAAPDL